MNKFQFRRLKKWQTGTSGSQMELAVPLPSSESGLVLRWCPNEGCRPRRFQIGDLAEDDAAIDPDVLTRREPGTTGTTCPYCGTDGTDEEFISPEDREAALEQVRWAVEEDFGRWTKEMAKEFNRKVGGKSNILGIKMTSSYRPKPAPRAWREDLLRVMDCSLCSRRYGVYAIGFFCPDCGVSNLSHQFEREVALIVAQIDVAEDVAELHSRELAYRLLGNAHEDVVTAFETYLKNSFRFAAQTRLPPDEWDDLLRKEVRRGNPFQNLNRAEGLFSKLGVDLFDDLDDPQGEALALNFEKRHVVGHNLGIADEKFVDVSETESIGETVPLLAHEVEEFARTALRVIARVEQDVPEFHPTGPEGSSFA